MSTIVPQPQHLAALDKANQIRLNRAAMKRRIASGETSVADVLREPPRYAETMTVFDLLAAQGRWGRQRTLRCLRQASIAEGKHLRALTVRQREAIVDELTPVVAATPASVAVWHSRYSDGRLHLVAAGQPDTACGVPVARGWREHAATDWRLEAKRCEICATHARINGWPVPDA